MIFFWGIWRPISTIQWWSIFLATLSVSYSSGQHDYEKIECTRGTFMCQPDVCIYEQYVCDGKPDCDNKKDESVCGSGTNCPLRHFGCNDGTCIETVKVCDRHSDCSEGEDESFCGKKCFSNEFTCADGQCVLGQNVLCNGKKECTDGSDEINCNSPHACRKDYFRCSNGSCIWTGLLCDGVNDCEDGADEQNCESTSPAPTCSSIFGCMFSSSETSSDQSSSVSSGSTRGQQCLLSQGCEGKVLGLVLGLTGLLVILIVSIFYWRQKQKVCAGDSRYSQLGRQEGRSSSSEAITMDDVT